MKKSKFYSLLNKAIQPNASTKAQKSVRSDSYNEKKTHLNNSVSTSAKRKHKSLA